MNNAADWSLIKTLFAGFPSRLFLAHTALEHIKLTESLSPSGLVDLQTIDLCHLHMNRLYKFIDYLTDGKDHSCSYETNSFDAEDLISGITSAFIKTISSYSSISTTFTSNLKSPHPVLVNQSKFETVILNILYSCLNENDFSKNAKTKLTLSLNETKNNIIFRIQTNSTNPDSELIHKTFSSGNFRNETLYTQNTVLALSLEIASKYVKEASGKLSFKALKSGNRYDISIPKFPKCTSNTMASSQIYIPTFERFEETFAEFMLLSTLHSIEKESAKK